MTSKARGRLESHVEEWPEAVQSAVTDADTSERIMRSAERMASLLDELMAIARHGLGQPGERNWEPGDLVALAERLEEERQALLAIPEIRSGESVKPPADRAPRVSRALRRG